MHLSQFKKALDLYLNEDIDTFGLSHQHPDNNSFILFNKGSYCFVDEGYNRNIKPFEHNNISVDNRALKAMDCNNVYRDSLFAEMESDNFDPYNFKGEIKRVEETKDYVIIEGESANIFDSDLEIESMNRIAVVQKDGIIVLIDNVVSKKAHKYTQHFHSDCKPEQKLNKYSYHNNLNKYDLYSFSDCQIDSEFTETIVRAVMTTQEPDKFRETKMETLNISNKELTYAIQFVTVIDLNCDNNQKIKLEYSPNELIVTNNDQSVVYSDLNKKLKIIKK